MSARGCLCCYEVCIQRRSFCTNWSSWSKFIAKWSIEDFTASALHREPFNASALHREDGHKHNQPSRYSYFVSQQQETELQMDGAQKNVGRGILCVPL